MADGSSVSALGNAPYEEMGPTILEMQPVTEPKTPKQATNEWVIAFKQLEQRMTALRMWRWSWWAHWNQLAEYFLPFRYVWLVTANKFNRGSPINNQIIDSTGLQAVRTCAAGMLSGLMSPFRPWFTLEIGLPWIELDEEGKAWLDDTQEKVYTVLDESNWYTIWAQAFQDLTVFGTTPVVIYEDFEDVIRCYCAAAGEYFLAAGARLSVDTYNREFTYTIGQIVEAFRIDNCPVSVSTLWSAGQVDSEKIVAHSIEPNFAFADKTGNEIRLLPSGFSYREVYWLRGENTEKPLSVRGFRSAPFVVARWATVSNNAYGRSPCMDALGDNKQVQLETLRKAEVIEKVVRPPMLADVQMKNEPASIVPGNITYVMNGGQGVGFKPAFQVDAQAIPALTKDIEQVNARIQACLYVDLFYAITRMDGVQPRNELELTQRNQERLQELGPFVKMFQNEVAGPAVRRVIEIMMAKRMLKPLPKSLQGVPIKFNYVSVMRLAQQALETVAMKDTLQTAGLMDAVAHAGGQKPPSRLINLDDAMRDYVKMNNSPANMLFTVEEVTANDKAMDQAATLQNAGQAAMAMVDAAKTASDTPLGNGSALDAALGTGARAPLPAPGIGLGPRAGV